MSSSALRDRYKNLRAEYDAALRYVVRIDETTWQVGAVLVGGSLAAVALSFDSQPKPSSLAPVFVGVAGIIATLSWFLLVRRNTDFIRIAKTRMRAIEMELATELYSRLEEGSVWGFTSVRFPNGQIQQVRVRGPNTSQLYSFLAGGIIFVLIAVIIYVVIAVYCPKCL